MAVRDILLLAAVIGSLPVCFLRPVYGILIWTAMAFLNPQQFTYGIASEQPLAMAIAIPTLLGFLAKSQFKHLLCPVACMLVALWLWFTITTVYSVHVPEFAEKSDRAWMRWNYVSKVILITLATIGVMNSRKHLRLLLLTVGGSFALLVFHALPGMILSGGEYRIYGPPNSMLANNNSFGLAVNMALPFFLFLSRAESDRRLKWFFGLAFVVGIPTVLFTYSRGAFLGLAALGLCMFVQSNQKVILGIVIVLAILFGGFFAPQKLRDRMDETTDTKESSAASRLNSWAFCWNLATAYPITGGGFEPYTPFLFSLYAPNPRDVHAAHSIYFGVLVEHGFVGFFLYFLLMGYCFVALRRVMKLARLNGDEQILNYANILRFSLVGFLVSGAFLNLTYFDFYFTITGCVAVLSLVCHEAIPGEDESDDELGDEDLPARLPYSHAGA